MSATQDERNQVQKQVLNPAVRNAERRGHTQMSGPARGQGQHLVQHAFMGEEWRWGSQLIQAQMNDLVTGRRP